MNHPLLIIGNKNYSSWSLRAWLLLKAFNIAFDEQLIQLFDPSSLPTLQKYSPTGKVPTLVVNPNHEEQDSIKITDSLAIAVYANDYLTDLDIWSGRNKSELQFDDLTARKARAFCQSIVTEMHAGFMAVRGAMPVNIRATAKVTVDNDCLKDLARIEQIFATCLHSFQNKSTQGYLFGRFTIADAWYAPVIFRLRTYAAVSGIKLKPTTERYCTTILQDPHVKQWVQAALVETRILMKDETGEILHLEGILAE